MLSMNEWCRTVGHDLGYVGKGQENQGGLGGHMRKVHPPDPLISSD